MNPLLFQVVFEGKLKDGVDRQKAVEKLAQTFRLNPESLRRLLSGAPVVIKRGLTPELAEKYKATIGGIGFEARIEQEPAQDDQAAGAKETKPDSGPLAVCPKCGNEFRLGSSSSNADECPKCGVIISKFVEARKAKEPPTAKQQDPATGFAAAATSEGERFDFPESGLLRQLCALEFTLPESLNLPAEEEPWQPASLKIRFFAALATLALWAYFALLLVNLAGLVMLLMLMTGTLPRMNMGDVDFIRAMCGMLAGPYVLIYLPLHWNGLTYGQRMMGIWVAAKDWRDVPIGFGAIMGRFAGTVLNFTSCGSVNVILPQVAGGKNLADTFTSTSQVQARSKELPSNPLKAALIPLACAFVCFLIVNITAKPFAIYFANKAAARNAPPQMSTTERAVRNNWQKVQEVQKKQAELLEGRSEMGLDVTNGPQARVAAPDRLRGTGRGTSPPEILNRFAQMQRKYFAANKSYSGDLAELLRLYGRDGFPNSASISAMIRDNDLKVELTGAGFLISIRTDDVWQTISEKGEMGVRPR